MSISDFYSLFCSDVKRGRKKRNSFYQYQYSYDEEQFIINELERYPVYQIPIWGPTVWKIMAESHSKVRESDPSRFPERTDNALRCHFQKQMLTSKGVVPIPDTLKDRLHKPSRKPMGGDSSVITEDEIFDEALDENRASKMARKHDSPFVMYNSDEDDFLLKTVNSYVGKPPVHGLKIWFDMARKFREIQKSDPARFPQERSAGSFRARFYRLSKQMPMNRPRRSPNQKSTKRDPSAPTMVGQPYMGSLGLKQRGKRFTQEEDDFIIAELLKPTCTSTRPRWKEIAAKHALKVESKTRGFPTHRTHGSLRFHFLQIICRGDRVPSDLKRKFPKCFSENLDQSCHESYLDEASCEMSDDENLEFWKTMTDEILDKSGSQEKPDREEEGFEEWISTMIKELSNMPDRTAFY